jgi:hypothetical protein
MLYFHCNFKVSPPLTEGQRAFLKAGDKTAIWSLGDRFSQSDIEISGYHRCEYDEDAPVESIQRYVKALRDFIETTLVPWGCTLSGVSEWDFDCSRNYGEIVVENNQITVLVPQLTLVDATKLYLPKDKTR